MSAPLQWVMRLLRKLKSMFKVKEKYNIAIIGATGIVGESLLNILHSRKFPVDKIVAIASSRSAGSKVKYGDTLIEVVAIDNYGFENIDIAFFSAGSGVSKKYAPIATQKGVVVIDNTSEFRYVDDIPLIVPEVNSVEISKHVKKNIIANPNCSTIQMLVALKPIHDRFQILDINVSTYQAVSGSGKKGVDELLSQSHSYMNQQKIKPSVYPKQIGFNVIPFVDSFCDNGYTKEEMKMVWETKKIFEDDSILVNPTAVRVPVFYGHSEAIHIETKEKIGAESAKELLKKMPGVTVIDEQKDGGYPTAVTEAAGENPVFVGRIREDISHPRGLNMWVVSDNVRKGAALNSIQIADILVKNYI